MSSYWIRVRVDGTLRWLVAAEFNGKLVIPELNQRFAYGIHQYMDEHPDNPVRRMPTYEQYEAICMRRDNA